MKIDISKLDHEPLPFDEKFLIEAERLGPDQVAGRVSVRLTGEVRPHEGVLSIAGGCSAEGPLSCSRCLEHVPWSVAEDFSLEYHLPESAPLDAEAGLDEDDLNVSFLHGQELDLAFLPIGVRGGVLADVEDAGDVAVGHFSCQEHLVAEALHRALVFGHVRPDGLERYAGAELGVLRLVDLSHAPPGDVAHDAESSGRQLSGSEAHRVGRKLAGLGDLVRRIYGGVGHASFKVSRTSKMSALELSSPGAGAW